MFLIKHFLSSTVHLGHKTNKWNPRTCIFLLGMRDGIFIIDLEQTIIMMKRAFSLVKKLCLRRGYIFYVPSLIQNDSFLKKKYIEKKIKPFTLTTEENNLIFLSPEFFSFSKQRGMLYAWIQKRKNIYTTSLNKNYIDNNENQKGFNLFFKPEVLFILKTNTNTALIKEAFKLQIPIIGILDSNSISYNIQYPIPGNDDNLDAQKLYTELLINTIIDAKKKEIKLISTKLK